VIPALIRRFIEAKRDGLPEVRLMGTGTARREFLHVDDLAQAALFLMENYDEDAPINVGASQDGTIEELACLIAMIVDYPGRIVFTGEGPDGMPRKLLDSSRIRAMGWEPKIGLAEGLKRTIKEVRI
jgi:GDP-L-fucose synthase